MCIFYKFFFSHIIIKKIFKFFLFFVISFKNSLLYFLFNPFTIDSLWILTPKISENIITYKSIHYLIYEIKLKLRFYCFLTTYLIFFVKNDLKFRKLNRIKYN